MDVIVTIVSKLVYFTYLPDISNLLIKGLFSPFTKYHGHPSNPETNSSPLKMDGWNTSFLLGWPIFRGKLLDFWGVILLACFLPC